VPTDAEVAKLRRDVPKMGLEETLEYAKTIIPDEVASSLFNLPLKYEMVLSNSYDLWFTAWPSRSKTTGLGATPADAFKIATGVDLLDVMRLGSRIIKRSTDGHQIRVTRDELIADGAPEVAIDYLFANMALTIDDFKDMLKADRDAGAIGHQRYTLTQYPFLAVDDPWGYGNSLEWVTSCPPPRHNFTELARIRSERPAFELHYPHMVDRMRAESHIGRHPELTFD
jgi:hypothetical protein